MSAAIIGADYQIVEQIEVPAPELANWQVTLDLLAEIAEVPAALIRRVQASGIKLLLSSPSPGNLYQPGEIVPQDLGLYCETVISGQRKLLVADARKEPAWAKNPDAARGMISYCGLPLSWPNGEIFGTISILDTQGNGYSERIQQLLERFRDSIQLRLAELYDAARARQPAERRQAVTPPAPDTTPELAEIIDSEKLQGLMEQFYRVTKIGIGIIDLHGRVLVGTGWQEICTKFHRLNPESCRLCLESDLELSRSVPGGTLYHCKNHMWDMAAPIKVGGTLVGNVFLGQFLFDDESVDYETFRRQARRYGFNEQEYLAALEKVPRWSRETVAGVIAFYTELAEMIGNLGYARVKLAGALGERMQAEEEVHKLNQDLELRVRERSAQLQGMNEQMKSELDERKRTEEALSASEARFRKIFEEGPLGIALVNTIDGKFIRTNAAFCQMLGYEREELKGLGFLDITHPEHRARDADMTQRLREGRIPRYQTEKQYLTKSGEPVWGMVTATLIRSDDGKPLCFLAMITDISERKKAEEQLRFFSDLVDIAPASITFNDQAGNMLYATRPPWTCMAIPGRSFSPSICMRSMSPPAPP